MPSPKKKHGKPKTPTVVANAKGIGNTNKKNKKEPLPPSKKIQMPKGLSYRAQTRWKNLAPLLIEMGTLTSVDVDAFVVYCESCSAYYSALQKLHKQGYVVESKDKASYRNPWVDIMNMAKKDMERYSTLFGLNASDRAGIEVDQITKAKSNPFANLKKDR